MLTAIIPIMISSPRIERSAILQRLSVSIILFIHHIRCIYANPNPWFPSK
ncbi:Uncharacterised protein [Vibrio cholerae]|nr:Uncharacterised protein [Vibrio cholerae]